MRTLPAILAVCISSALMAHSDTVAVKYAATISADDLRSHLTVLASDEFEGRETGFKGQKMAADYIRKQFKENGIPALPIGTERPDILENGYDQTFKLELKKPGGIVVESAGETYEFLDDLLFFSKELKTSIESDELMFAGYGLRSVNHNDLEGVSCNGCVMMVLSGLPETKSTIITHPLQDTPSRSL